MTDARGTVPQSGLAASMEQYDASTASRKTSHELIE
jgi:hypothetical protein